MSLLLSDPTWNRTIAGLTLASFAASKEFCISSLTILAGGRLLNRAVFSELNPTKEVALPNLRVAISYSSPFRVFMAPRRTWHAWFTSSWVVNLPKLILNAVLAVSGSRPRAVITCDGSGEPVEHAAPVDIAISSETVSTNTSPGIFGMPRFKFPGIRSSREPNFIISENSSSSSST